MDKKRSALFVMDLQYGILEVVGESTVSVVQNAAKAVKKARETGIPVIHVVFEVTDFPTHKNKLVSSVNAYLKDHLKGEKAAIHTDVAPIKGEHTISRIRAGAFSGTCLDILLRELDVDHLVLCGIATSGVVLSTLKQASDLDFKLSVISDCCADPDPEVHRVLMGKIFPGHADIITHQQFIDSL